MTKWRKSPPELIDLFAQSLTAFPDAEPRKMFGYPCAFVNGNMCTGLHQEDWVVRLSPADKEEFQNTYGASQFAPMGRVMREYVSLPEEILNSTSLLQSWLKKSFSFTSALPPKKSKKKS